MEFLRKVLRQIVLRQYLNCQKRTLLTNTPQRTHYYLQKRVTLDNRDQLTMSINGAGGPRPLLILTSVTLALITDCTVALAATVLDRLMDAQGKYLIIYNYYLPIEI